MSRLFWKILLTFWVSLLLLLTAANLPSLLEQWRTRQLSTEVVASPLSIVTVKAAATTFLHGGAGALHAMLSEQDREAPQELQVYALDAQGKELLGRTVDEGTRQRVLKQANTPLAFPVVRTVESGSTRLILFAPWSGQYTAFRQTNHWKLNRKHMSDLLWFCGLVAASLSASLLLAWHFSHPVQQLKQAFAALASGQMDSRVDPAISRRYDELADLGQAFDAMATQLQALMVSREQLLEAQQALLHDVSHELRAPLTRLQMSISLARQQPETLDSSFTRIEQEAGRLERLVHEVLELSQLESTEVWQREEYVDVPVLLQTLTERVRFEAEATGCLLDLQTPPDSSVCILQGNAELLYRALENVLRNAIHYTRRGTIVTASLQPDNDDDWIEIRITDQGPGVPTADLENMFQPFRRITTQTGGTTPRSGYGLGLAIARKAIEFHGGTITARHHDQGEGGLEVVIRLKPETRLHPYIETDPPKRNTA